MLAPFSAPSLRMLVMRFPMVFLIFPAMYVPILGPALPTVDNSFVER